MANQDEPTLRNALDAVNAGRRWTLLGVSALFFAVLLTLAFVFSMLIPSIVQPPSDTPAVEVNRSVPPNALWIYVTVQTFFTACGTAALMLHVSRMTRTILRAIEATRSK